VPSLVSETRARLISILSLGQLKFSKGIRQVIADRNLAPFAIVSAYRKKANEEIIPFVIATVAQASQNIQRIRPFSSNNNLYVNELLTTAHPQRCWDVLRMTIVIFLALRDWLLTNTLLKSSRQKSGVSIAEKIDRISLGEPLVMLARRNGVRLF
jgi:hypothetical protein